MPVLYLTADLMFSSKVAGAARTQGIELTTAASSASLLEKSSERPADLVLIDLTTPGLDIGRLVAELQQLETPPKSIVAYGPHVQEALLKTAAEAGCSQVLSRGEFDRTVDELLRREKMG